MEKIILHKKDWAGYYESQKKVWYDPNISIWVKLIVRIVELHRSDSQGWYISIRKIAGCLGCSPHTVQREIKEAIKLGFIDVSTSNQRVRRKLRLSVSLRAPLEHESTNSSRLMHWTQQTVSLTAPSTVSLVGTVNSKRNIKIISSFSEDKNKTTHNATFKEEEGYKKLRATVDSLRHQAHKNMKTMG